MLEWWLAVGPPCPCCGAALQVTFYDDERDARAAACAVGFRVIEGSRRVAGFLGENNARRRRHHATSTVPSTR